MAEKGLPELGFTLGGLDELAHDNVRLLIAVDPEFLPVHAPLYLAYADSAALASIGNAVTRAHLPSTTPRQLTRLARKLL